jgi:hypothetical protein
VDRADADGVEGERRVKVLILSRYDRMGASSRLRTLQYADVLCAHNLEPLFQPFFEDRYLNLLYSGQATSGAVLRAYVRRLAQLQRRADADLIWIERKRCLGCLGGLSGLCCPRQFRLSPITTTQSSIGMTCIDPLLSGGSLAESSTD